MDSIRLADGRRPVEQAREAELRIQLRKHQITVAWDDFKDESGDGKHLRVSGDRSVRADAHDTLDVEDRIINYIRNGDPTLLAVVSYCRRAAYGESTAAV